MLIIIYDNLVYKIQSNPKKRHPVWSHRKFVPSSSSSSSTRHSGVPSQSPEQRCKHKCHPVLSHERVT